MMDNLIRELVRDLADEARPADLGPRAVASGRRLRQRRAAAIAVASLAVLAAAVAVPVLLRPGSTSGIPFAGTLEGAGDAVDVAISPDGTILAAAGGNDHTVVLWDAGSGERLRVLTGGAVVNAVAFGPDGRLLATGSDLWNARTGERTASEFAGGAYDVAVSPDGALVATANGYEPNGIRLYDSATGALVRTITQQWAGALAFSADGTLLAGVTADGVVLWRVDSGEPVRILDTLAGGVAFSPDGRLLATWGDGADARLWDPDSGAVVRSLPVPGGLGFSPDGTVFAGTDANGVVQLVDAETGTILRTLDDVYATALAFSPDGERVLVRTPDSRIQIHVVGPADPTVSGCASVCAATS